MLNYYYNDAGRSKSTRPLQRQDCVIRAIAIVEGVSYDYIYDYFAALGRKCSRSTPKKLWQGYLNYHPKFTKISFPAIKGKARMSLKHFCIAYPKGRYICQMAGHLTAVIDSGVCDDFMPKEDMCVYAVWKLKE